MQTELGGGAISSSPSLALPRSAMPAGLRATLEFGSSPGAVLRVKLTGARGAAWKRGPRQPAQPAGTGVTHEVGGPWGQEGLSEACWMTSTSQVTHLFVSSPPQ